MRGGYHGLDNPTIQERLSKRQSHSPAAEVVEEESAPWGLPVSRGLSGGETEED
jgi:hypothetical protein